ncbi:MAG TPA: hypothetical protein VLF14_02715, partial [Candidatus Binatia bacterium]|nr:hypothetical protein [Candidatus Binatia bacterium]
MADTKAAYKEPATPPRIEVSLAALLQDWKGAYDRGRAYLSALGLSSSSDQALVLRSVEEAVSAPEWPADSDAYSETFGTLRREIVGRREPFHERSFLDWRLARLFGKDASPAPMPALARRSMEPHRIQRRGLRRRLIAAEEADRTSAAPADNGDRVPRAVRAMRLRLRWVRVAFRRRALLSLLVLIPTVIASGFMLQVLPYQGRTWLEATIVIFFGALFGWISIGFWTALVGFGILLLRRDRFRITASLDEAPVELDRKARTAIVMTIADEPVDRVFAG